MKQILLPILTVLILAPSGLHAGLDSWISSILPEKMRASETVRSSIYAATNRLKIKKPVLVMHESLEKGTLAEAENYLPFSIIKVSNETLANHTIETQNKTGYHETGHVLHNHYMVDNTLEAISTPSYIFATLTSWYGIIRRSSLTPFRKHGLLATSTASLLASFLAHNHTPDHTVATIRRYELEADTVAFSLINELDGPAQLENELALNEKLAQSEGWDYRARSNQHPTIDEESALIRAALDKKPL